LKGGENVKNLTRCPICGGKLIVKEVHCPNCKTTIRGEFATGGFSELDEKQTEFVRLFLRFHGNINKVAESLGISYPTVKNRIRGINHLLGNEEESDRAEVLDKLDRGEITFDVAMKLLKGGL